jgi:hypothetical protein
MHAENGGTPEPPFIRAGSLKAGSLSPFSARSVPRAPNPPGRQSSGYARSWAEGCAFRQTQDQDDERHVTNPKRESPPAPTALKWLAALSVAVGVLGAAATILTLAGMLGAQLPFGQQTLVTSGLPYFVVALVCFGVIAYGLIAKHRWPRPFLVGIWVLISIGVCIYAIRSPSHGVLDTVVKIPAVIMYVVSDVALIGYFYFKKEVVAYYRALATHKSVERDARPHDKA